MQRVYSVCSPKPTNDQLALQETVFHNANGYLGVRGTLEEGAPQGMDTMRGAYVNGFYEIVPMKQAEKLTHVREDKESMINVADVQGIRFRLAGEWFSQWTGTLVESERRLDMDRGITERRVRWRSPEGRETALCFRRMASFAEPSLFLIDCEVTPLNYEGEVEVESTHLALVKNYANPNDPRLAGESECHLERAVADHRREARAGAGHAECANGLRPRGTRGRVPCLRDGRTGTNAAAAKILRLFR